jgi:hypothetical protein
LAGEVLQKPKRAKIAAIFAVGLIFRLLRITAFSGEAIQLAVSSKRRIIISNFLSLRK